MTFENLCYPKEPVDTYGPKIDNLTSKFMFQTKHVKQTIGYQQDALSFLAIKIMIIANNTFRHKFIMEFFIGNPQDRWANKAWEIPLNTIRVARVILFSHSLFVQNYFSFIFCRNFSWGSRFTMTSINAYSPFSPINLLPIYLI